MLYPNQFSVDLMEGGGQPPAPVGMLRVKLIRIENLKKSDIISKSDAYCLLEVFITPYIGRSPCSTKDTVLSGSRRKATSQQNC